MVFISRGRTVRFHDLAHERLVDIMSRYIGEEFTGRLVVNLEDAVVEVELLRGRIVALVAQDKKTGAILYGDDALPLLDKALRSETGFVEVIELDDARVSVDLDTFPQARLSEGGVEEATPG